MLHGRVTISNFDFLVEMIQSKLASCSVITSIPTYHYEVQWLPQKTCDSLDRVAKSFIWSCTMEKRVHLVK